MSKDAFGKSDGAKKLTCYWFHPDDLNIATDPTDPLYDSRIMEPVGDDFVRTIIEEGIIQPIVISKRDSKPWVTAGRRRTLGARKANETLSGTGSPQVLVPCVYKTGSDEKNVKRMVIENEHRKPDNVIQRAEKCQRMMDMGYGVSDIAPSFGVTTATIGNWLKLLKLPKEKRDAIIRGELKASRARDTVAGEARGYHRTLRKKAEIAAKAENELPLLSDDKTYSKGFYDALKWVLGDD